MTDIVHGQRYAAAERTLRDVDQRRDAIDAVAALIQERSGSTDGEMDPLVTMFMRLRLVELLI